MDTNNLNVSIFTVTSPPTAPPLPVSVQDLQAEKLLQFFFGHRSHNDGSFGKGPVQRWLHLRGCHLMLLMALTVKYRLSPLGVEDIIEQGFTHG
jgi:hypothetical protein